MDTVTERTEIPKIVLDAYDLLLQHRIVEITRPLDLNSKGKGWKFECIVSVSHPNRENIPSAVPLEVLIREAFPLAPVEFYPDCEEVTGFPHQDAESGKLCLPEERLAPRDARRLVHYVNWAKEWLADAANGNLLKPGDPYELPDFSRRLLTERLPINLPVLFNETGKSYEKWKLKIGNFGVVECILGKGVPAIFAVRFSDKNRTLVWESEFSSNILDQGSQIVGRWLMLPDIRFKRYRPPQTYKEIVELCSANNLCFYDILKQAWEADNRSSEIGLVLIGFPIPKNCDEEAIEIHWQPLLFSNLRAEQKSRKESKKSRKRKKTWNDLRSNGHFKLSQQLPWGKSSNVTHDRMYARGSYSPSLQSARIAIFGCGALGSSIAELLVRGGVKVLDLFDPKSVQIGNFCRHTLDGTYLGLNKARSLARRLSTANPLSSINAYPVGIPPSYSAQQNAYDVISSTDLIIDCTTSELAFDWLDHYTITENKRMVSLFFNFGAELLTLCISGTEASCGEIFQDLVSCAKNDQLPIASQEYLYQPTKEEQIIEGAGCWHPTFPALNAHIQILAATAVEIINANIKQGEGKGLTVIVRRNSLDGKKIQPSPLVEMIWIKQYP